MEILWRQSFDEKEDDFSAYADGKYIGRVYYVTTSGVKPYWAWFLAKGGPHGSGQCQSRREALLAVEQGWEK